MLNGPVEYEQATSISSMLSEELSEKEFDSLKIANSAWHCLLCTTNSLISIDNSFYIEK